MMVSNTPIYLAQIDDFDNDNSEPSNDERNPSPLHLTISPVDCTNIILPSTSSLLH